MEMGVGPSGGLLYQGRGESILGQGWGGDKLGRLVGINHHRQHGGISWGSDSRVAGQAIGSAALREGSL